MASVSLGVPFSSSSNASSYTSGSFTPSQGDLILVLVAATATAAAGSISSTQSLGWTNVVFATKNSSLDRLYVFVANTFASNSSMTVTFNCTGDAATGAVLNALIISGMSRAGASAVRQSKPVNNQAASTPSITFDSACLASNPVVLLQANASTGVPSLSGWTLLDSNTYSNPTLGFGSYSVNSGFSGDTITWPSSTTAHGLIGVELDASGYVPPPLTMAPYMST